MNKRVVVIGLSGESVFLTTDHFHRPAETIKATSLVIEPGGKGYNQAVALKKLGVDVTYLTAVGTDQYASYLIDYLVDLGIDVQYKTIEGNSAYAVILTDKDGNNQVTVYDGASKKLKKEDVLLVKEAIKEADYLLVQLEIIDEVLLEAMAQAKENNTKIVLNPAPAIIDINNELCQMADILTPNEVEVRDLFDIPRNIGIDKYGEYLSKITNKELVITLGSKGALYVKRGYYKYFEPLNVKVVDTTGAGDVFNAGLVKMLVDGHNMDDSVSFAIKAAGISVTKNHVMNSIPTLEEVLKVK